MPSPCRRSPSTGEVGGLSLSTQRADDRSFVAIAEAVRHGRNANESPSCRCRGGGPDKQLAAALDDVAALGSGMAMAADRGARFDLGGPNTVT